MKPEDVPDDLIRVAVRANADRNHANLCGCVAWPEWCTSDYSPTQWEHGDESETIAAVWPEIEKRVREQVAAEIRETARSLREDGQISQDGWRGYTAAAYIAGGESR